RSVSGLQGRFHAVLPAKSSSFRVWLRRSLVLAVRRRIRACGPDSVLRPRKSLDLPGEENALLALATDDRRADGDVIGYLLLGNVDAQLDLSLETSRAATDLDARILGIDRPAADLDLGEVDGEGHLRRVQVDGEVDLERPPGKSVRGGVEDGLVNLVVLDV